MLNLTRFNEVLEAIDKLQPEDQEALIGIVKRRRIAQRRAELAKDIEETRKEFRAGLCLPQSPKDLMGEILS